MSNLKNGGYNERNIEAWRKLNQDLFKEEGVKQEDVAGKMKVRPSILSIMLGGKDRLSLKNLARLERWHIQSDGIKSSDRFQEWLDCARLCPGYKLDADEEDWLREVAEEEFRLKNIITVNAITAEVNRLYNMVRALSKRDFGSLKEVLRDVNFQRLLKLFELWREE